MSIVHCFSCRLYGSRNYTKEVKNKLQETLDNPRHNLLISKDIQC
jgi:putative resolvase